MTTPQNIAALNQANRVRLARARLKREVASLPRREAMGVLADVVEHPPKECLSAPVMELVMAVRHMGRYYALRLLRGAGVAELTRVGELTGRQRQALAERLRLGERIAA